MSATVEQIYIANPSTTIADGDLIYLVQSPYTPGTDSAIIGSDLKSLFLQAANNLSDVSSIPGARANLGLSAIAIATPPLSPILGGTGINNGASTITIGGSLSFIGAFTFAGTLTGNTAVTFPTSGTLATTSQLLVSPLTTKGDIWVWSTTNDRLPVATGDGKILQVSAAAATGLAYSTATYPSTATGTGTLLQADGTNWVPTTATYPGVATGTGTILRANGTNWVATTATYPATTTINQILYSSANNTISEISTVNGGVLVSNNTGVPSMLANPGATGRILQSANAAIPTWSTATYPATAGTSGNVLTSDGTNFVSSAPAAVSGRLINVQVFTASGTYTATAGAVTAIVKLTGSGGGGAGSGSAGGGTGGTPSANTFGAILTANGGAGGVFAAGTGGAGGTASGANIANLQGGPGLGLAVTATTYGIGGIGGSSVLGGGARGPALSNAGITAGANTGGGGSGGSGNGTSTAPGSGGGAGGYCEHYWTISSPQTVTINNGGAAGTAGTSGQAGGAGAAGICIVYEYS